MNIETVNSILKDYVKGNSVEILSNIVMSYEDTNNILYEVIGLLQEGISYKNIIEDYSAGNTGWSGSCYKEYKRQRDIADALLLKPLEIKDGEIECPKCKKTKTLVVEMQTRSADEGFTYYIHCFNPRCKVITKT